MNIREDCADIVPAFQNADGLVSIRSRYGLKPNLFDHVERGRLDELFILHYKDDWLLTGSHSAHLRPLHERFFRL